MIKLSNGYKFSVACASGAFAFLNGWWWERPLDWFGLLRPEEWTITLKTLTLQPRKGNLRIWWPFNLYRNCVRNFKCDGIRGTVNAVGLTNPGLRYWIDRYYPKVYDKALNVIVSVMPESEYEAHVMGQLLAPLRSIRGIEINFSCPNVEHADQSVEFAAKLIRAFKGTCDHPIGLKLSPHDDYYDMLDVLGSQLEWATLFNTYRWSKLFPKVQSPLHPLEGGISGPPLVPFARYALKACRPVVTVPLVSCGGIDTLEEARVRFRLGASAVQIGTFIKDHPVRAQRLHDDIVRLTR